MEIDIRRIEVVDECMVPILRAKSGAERLQMIWSMFRFARQLVEASERSAHPEWDDGQIRKAVVRRISHGAA